MGGPCSLRTNRSDGARCERCERCERVVGAVGPPAAVRAGAVHPDGLLRAHHAGELPQGPRARGARARAPRRLRAALPRAHLHPREKRHPPRREARQHLLRRRQSRPARRFRTLPHPQRRQPRFHLFFHVTSSRFPPRNARTPRFPPVYPAPPRRRASEHKSTRRRNNSRSTPPTTTKAMCFPREWCCTK